MKPNDDNRIIPLFYFNQTTQTTQVTLNNNNNENT